MLPPGFRSGFVVLWGRPNVGKSTLLNAMVGEKVAIVSPRPQTTRNRIVGIRNRDDAQLVFVDTPGIHRPKHLLGESLVGAARGALPDAEVVLVVVDISEAPGPSDRQAAQMLTRARAPRLLAANKCDLLGDVMPDAHIAEYAELFGTGHAVLVSATEKRGVDALETEIIALLPEGPQYYPPEMSTDQLESFSTAEIIREKVLLLTRQEVPHAVAVVVNSVEERADDLIYIAADIIVERSSQKQILIGERGQMISSIGRTAREDLEQFFGTRVYLDLHVKVREKWRQQENMLRRLGYVPPRH